MTGEGVIGEGGGRLTGDKGDKQGVDRADRGGGDTGGGDGQGAEHRTQHNLLACVE